MIGKHPLALPGEISVIQNCAQEEKACQPESHPSPPGRELSLDEGKKGRKQRDRGEDDKVYESKKVKMGWHAAPGFRLGAWIEAGGIVNCRSMP